MIAQDDKSPEIGFGYAVRRLWPVLRGYRGRFGLGIALILGTTLTEILTPIIIGYTVDAAISPDPSRRRLFELCGIYGVFILIKNLLDSTQAYVIQMTGQSITHDLRCALFSRIERLPIPYFDRNPTGRLLTRVINDIKSLSELFTASISVLVLDLMIIFGTVVAMFWVDWKLAAVTLVTFPFVMLTIRLYGMKLAVAYRNVRLRLAEINAFLGENIGAIATIQRLSAERSRHEKFSRIVDKHHAAQLDSLRVFATVQPIANLLNGVSMGSLLVVGGYWVIGGKISLGVVVAFLGYLRNIFQPVRDLVEKYNTFLSAMVSAERVVAILDEKTEDELPHTVNWVVPRFTRDEMKDAGIRFENVSFCYPTREMGALTDVSFKLRPGEQLAVVGPTGSGKSTLVRLLLRFYEPDEGSIYVGSLDIREWDRKALRQYVGVVHQEIFLFGGTLRENLTLGRDHFSDEFLIEQCRRVQLWDFIERRGGLDMHCLEGGTNFSLGERQLISFARVLVLDTPILILDEATSNVDRLLERRLMEAISEVIRGRTSIVIAHRLSTIRECKEILVLEKGQVEEVGSYDALLEQAGLFRRFHEIHSRS